MDGACKEWWYKDKMMGVSKKGYFCLFKPYILTINYRCLEDLLLIFGPSWAQNTILPKNYMGVNPLFYRDLGKAIAHFSKFSITDE